MWGPHVSGMAHGGPSPPSRLGLAWRTRARGADAAPTRLPRACHGGEGDEVALPHHHRRRRRSALSSPALRATASSAEGLNAKIRRWGTRCSPRRRKGTKRWPTTTKRAVARYGLTAATGSGGAPAKRERAPGSRRDGDEDGGSIEVAASMAVAQSELQASVAGGEEASNTASTR